MISKTFQGYTISKHRKNNKFPVYVKSIYRGKITWTLDYLYAKHYTQKTAARINAEIDNDIKNGLFPELIIDCEVKKA